jgi:hypothetical protein
MNRNSIQTIISVFLLGGAAIYIILAQDLRIFIQSFKWGLRSADIQILSFFIGIIVCSIAGYTISLSIKEKSTSRIATPFGAIMSVFLMAYWFIPMTGTGAMGANWYNIPVVVRNQYRISCLFTHSSRSWPTAHFEVLKQGESEWEEGPLEGFFDLDIFGYRSRFNRILSASKGKYKEGKSKGKLYPSNRKRLQEMSEYIAQTWGKNNPADPPVTKVRLSLANHPTGKKHCMAREAWGRPPLTDIPTKYVREVGIFPMKDSSDNSTTPLKKNATPRKISPEIKQRSLTVPKTKILNKTQPDTPTPKTNDDNSTTNTKKQEVPAND